MALSDPKLQAIGDEFSRLAQKFYHLTREPAPDGQWLYTVIDEDGEPVNSIITPDPDITSMLVFGPFAFHGCCDDYLKGKHLRAWHKALKECREAEASGDEERLLHKAIALDKLAILAHLAE